MAKKNVFKKVAAGAAIAGAIGYVAGVLSAPKSGKQTRAELKVKGSKDFELTEDKLKILCTQLGELISAAKDEAGTLSGRNLKRFESALSRAELTRDKLNTFANALKSGSTEDKDLDKAIKEAEKAIAHAKTFLLKP